MSFKINDYNAFLTSLFDKNNANPNSSSPPPGNIQQHRLLQPNSAAAAAAFQQQHQLQFGNGGMDDGNPAFPVDFEFGLIPPQQPQQLPLPPPQQQVPSHQSSLSSDDSSPTYNNRSKSINYPITSQQQQQPTQSQQQQQSQLQNEYIPDITNSMSPPSSNKQFSPNQQQPQQQQQNQILSQPDNLFPLSYMGTYSGHSELASPLNNASNPAHNDLFIKQDPLYQQQQQQQMLLHQQAQNNQQQQMFVKQEDESNSLSPLSSNQSPWNNVNQPTQFQPIPPPVQPIVTKVRSNNSNSTASSTIANGNRKKSAYSFDGSSPVSSATTLNHQGPGRPRVKSAHNVIEQRYRNKINDKFTALQESVPTLKILARRKQRQLQRQQENGGINGDVDIDSSEEDNDFDGHGYDDPNEEVIDLEGLEPARKLNKGTILAKSIEYIKFLELKNDRIRQENNELVMKARMLGIQFDSELINDDSRR